MMLREFLKKWSYYDQKDVHLFEDTDVPGIMLTAVYNSRHYVKWVLLLSAF